MDILYSFGKTHAETITVSAVASNENAFLMVSIIDTRSCHGCCSRRGVFNVYCDRVQWEETATDNYDRGNCYGLRRMPGSKLMYCNKCRPGLSLPLFL